jgi:hypothetical protein
MASDKVDKYFNCKEGKYITCCKGCKYAGCALDCVHGQDCHDGQGTIDIACPRMEFVKEGFSDTKMINATFSFKDEDGFFKDMAETWGIDKSWISFGKRRVQYSNGCQYAEEEVDECMEKANDWWHDYPLANDNVETYNPKEIIGESYDASIELLDRFKIMRTAGAYDGKTIPYTTYVRHTLTSYAHLQS